MTASTPGPAETLWVKTAWASDGHSLPWLIAAYDEGTFDEWGEEPDFYTDAVKEAGPGHNVRTLLLTIPLDAVRDLYRTPNVVAAAASEEPSDV